MCIICEIGAIDDAEMSDAEVDALLSGIAEKYRAERLAKADEVAGTERFVRDMLAIIQAVETVEELENLLHSETERLGVIHAEAHYGTEEWTATEKLFRGVVITAFKAGYRFAKD